MRKIPLSENELESIRPGEAITLAGVLAIMAVAIIAVIVYKLFIKDTGNFQVDILLNGNNEQNKRFN